MSTLYSTSAATPGSAWVFGTFATAANYPVSGALQIPVTGDMLNVQITHQVDFDDSSKGTQILIVNGVAGAIINLEMQWGTGGLALNGDADVVLSASGGECLFASQTNWDFSGVTGGNLILTDGAPIIFTANFDFSGGAFNPETGYGNIAHSFGTSIVFPSGRTISNVGRTVLNAASMTGGIDG